MKNILLIEDEVGILDLIDTIISRSCKAVIHRAKNSCEAEAVLEKTNAKIDLIISDIYHPGMDGLMQAQLIHCAHPRIPIYIVSGNLSASREYEDRLKANGIIKGYMQKPFEHADLITFVKKELE